MRYSVLSEGVYLYTSREVVSGAHVAVYEVECTLLKALSFEVDISLSQNFKIDGTADTKVQVQVGPFQRTRVAQLAPVDASRRSVLKVQYRWSLSDLVVPEDQIRRDTTARDEAVEVSLRIPLNCACFINLFLLATLTKSNCPAPWGHGWASAVGGCGPGAVCGGWRAVC